MKVLIDDRYFEVQVVKKKIKNTYLRVKSDLKIHVSTNKYAKLSDIESLINSNITTIKKMIEREEKKLIKNSKFFYLGREYPIVICNNFKKPQIIDDVMYVDDIKKLDSFLRREAKKIFSERLQVCYDLMQESNIPFPRLGIRKMTRKWGYCNKSESLVTLNLELIKYGIDEIDYVIIHELCHLIHFNHSKAFWDCVNYYKPNYKVNRKVLREE